MHNHPGKMEVCQIEKNAVEWKPIKFQKSKIKNQKRKRKKGSLGWIPERAT